jgi:hypothetical protein
MAVSGGFSRIDPDLTHDKHGPMSSNVSNFLISMNTNVRIRAESADLPRLTEPLYQMCEHLFGASATVSQFVQFGRRGPMDRGKRTFVPDPTILWSPETVRDFKSVAGVEVGHNLRGQRLHCHCAVKIRHYSFIRLDKDKILAAANEFLESVGYPYPIVHINIRVLPPSIEDYLDK